MAQPYQNVLWACCLHSLKNAFNHLTGGIISITECCWVTAVIHLIDPL